MRPDDIILITGKKRSGKSYFLTHFLIPLFFQSKIRILIWDYNWEHKGQAITHNLNDLIEFFNRGTQLIVYQPIQKNPSDFSLFCQTALRLHNIMLCIEEVERYADHFIVYNQPNFKALIDSGRHRGLGLICTSRRVTWLASDIPFNLDYLFIFKQTRPQDLKYLSEWVGDGVYEIEKMEEYSFLCWNDANGTLTKMKPM